MDNLQSPPPASAELVELRSQYHHLQQLVSSLLLVVIVISGTLTVFLLRQWRFVKSELDAVSPQAAQLIMEYTNSYAMSQEFARKLAEYGRTHQDFAPIVQKYSLNNMLAKPGTTAVTNSLPAAASKK